MTVPSAWPWAHRAGGDWNGTASPAPCKCVTWQATQKPPLGLPVLPYKSAQRDLAGVQPNLAQTPSQFVSQLLRKTNLCDERAPEHPHLCFGFEKEKEIKPRFCSA